MEFFIGILISALVSSLLSIIFSEQIKSYLSPIFAHFIGYQTVDFTGRWEAKFSVEEDDGLKEYTEVIDLKRKFGLIIGRIVVDDRNYEKLKNSKCDQALRVRGEIKGNYFSGIWLHPIQTYRFHGVFQLKLDETGNKLIGKWVGYIQDKSKIDSGSWKWTRLAQ